MGVFLDTKAGLEFLENDKALYTYLLETYLTEDKFNEAHLNQLISSGDFLAAAKYVHRIKGASYQIAANQVADKAKELENVLRGKTSGNLEKLSKEFCLLYTRTVEEVKTEVSKH